MPISTFSPGLRNALVFFPGTYGTSLVRNHALRGVLSEMESVGVPETALSAVRDIADCNLYAFGEKVEVWVCYLVLVCSVLLLVGGYLLMTWLLSKRGKRTSEKNVKSE